MTSVPVPSPYSWALTDHRRNDRPYCVTRPRHVRNWAKNAKGYNEHAICITNDRASNGHVYQKSELG